MAHVAEVSVVIAPRSQHLTEQEVAAYVDGATTLDARTQIVHHLGDCSECRTEVVEAARIANSIPGAQRSRARIWIPLAAAAALVFLLLRPDVLRQPAGEHREPPVTTTVLPRAVAPVGSVDSMPSLIWTSVPNADRYHVRLLDGGGTVLWERDVNDTTVGAPPTLRLEPNRPYYWKVEAQTGFDRGAASEWARFSIMRAARP